MANATVKLPFTDKDTRKVYSAGDTFSGTAERIAELAGKGYVERPKAAAKKAAPKTAKAAAAKAEKAAENDGK